MSEYNLTFTEAMKVLEEGKYGITKVQGENFSNGMYIQEGLFYIEGYSPLTDKIQELKLTLNLINQKYKVFKDCEDE